MHNLVDNRLITGSASTFEFRKSFINDTNYSVHIDNSIDPIITFSELDAVNESSVPYTANDLRIFKETYTGFNRASASGAYTQSQVDKAIRMTLTPYKLVTYPPSTTPYTMSSITANISTKLLIPTTVKTVNAFAIVDLGGGNLAYPYQGSITAVFEVSMTTGLLTGTNNTVVALEIFKNGVLEPGTSTVRKVSSSDVGNMAITGEITLSPMDTISLYATTSLTSTITFSRVSIQVCERN